MRFAILLSIIAISVCASVQTETFYGLTPQEQQIVDAAKKVLDKVKLDANKVWNNVKTVAAKIADENAAKTFAEAKPKNNKKKTFLQTRQLWDSIKNGLKKIGGSIVNGAKKVGAFAKEAYGVVAKGVMNIFKPKAAPAEAAPEAAPEAAHEAAHEAAPEAAHEAAPEAAPAFFYEEAKPRKNKNKTKKRKDF